jgi:twitching motility protein PilI
MDTTSHPPLMTPAEALTRGFVQAPVATAAATTAASADAVQARQGFRIGELRLMVRYEEGSELTDLPATYSLPNAPAWFHGIANLHGNLTPVFDLGAFAGAAATEAAHPMLLVLSRGADAAGIVIDGLPQRLRWTADQAVSSSLAPAALDGAVRDAVLVDGHVVLDLDCAALLDKFETALDSALPGRP